MTEPNGNDTTTATTTTTTTTKKSVVDDFFSALFANNTGASHSTPASSDEASEHTTTTTTTTTNTKEANIVVNQEGEEYKYHGNNHNHNNHNNHVNDEQDEQDRIHGAAGRKRERVLDEFDEYSLLSKRRGSDNRNKNNFHNRRKPIEARDIIQDVNDQMDDDVDDDGNNIKLDRQILSKRDIDWSTVKPESRMLVRQLPKFIDKQDVMNYFSKYGEVLEVVQKVPFGFVHFENPEACAQAVQIENGKPFHGIVLDLEICKRKPFFARAAERELRDSSNMNMKEERNLSPGPASAGRRNSHTRNSDPRSSRGNNNNNNNIRHEQYDPYENRNHSPPPSRYQQQQQQQHNPPPPPRRAGAGRNNDRNNDYRPDYGRGMNDYSTGNKNNNSNNGRHQEYNNRQQDNHGRNYRPNPYSRYNNTNNDEGSRNSYAPRYNDTPMNSYTPRYNNSNTNEDPRSYNPCYNNDKPETSRNTYRYNDNRYNDNRYHDAVTTTTTTAGASIAPITRNYNTSPMNLSTSLIPSRQGNEVPVVQIVAWDNVAYGFTDYIERVFSSNQIRASSITLPFSNHSRDEIVKQMIMEGVKAIVMIDRENEAKNKIYLQVFAPTEHGQGVRYDEYDSVTAIEAVNIIRRSYPVPMMMASSSSSAAAAAAAAAPPAAIVPAAVPQPSQPTVAAPAIDMNTLASLYNMIQPKPSVSPQVSNQPTIPQLLATLVNGLNVNSSPPPLPQPQPTYQPVIEQPNIAALISTAANGNPALAQLLAQMTSGNNSNTLGYSPSMPYVDTPTLGYPSNEQHQQK